jgi:hypothetical protein
MLRLSTCSHQPPCPTINPWVCSQRTRIEEGVRRGQISRQDGLSLLTKYQTVMTPASTVYRGAVVDPQGKLTL